jgi:hypothetical protein
VTSTSVSFLSSGRRGIAHRPVSRSADDPADSVSRTSVSTSRPCLTPAQPLVRPPREVTHLRTRPAGRFSELRRPHATLCRADTSVSALANVIVVHEAEPSVHADGRRVAKWETPQPIHMR